MTFELDHYEDELLNLRACVSDDTLSLRSCIMYHYMFSKLRWMVRSALQSGSRKVFSREKPAVLHDAVQGVVMFPWKLGC